VTVLSSLNWHSATVRYSAAAALVIVLVDVLTRLSGTTSNSSDVGVLDQAIPVIEWSKIDQAQLDSIQALYQKYDPTPPPAPVAPAPVAKPKVKVLSLAEQKGELRQLMIAERRYELMAVIAPETLSTYALVRSTHIETGKTEIQRYDDGADLSGLTLAITSMTRIQLTASRSLIEAEGLEEGFEPIILMMYNR
jgi:hypothetical protein